MDGFSLSASKANWKDSATLYEPNGMDLSDRRTEYWDSLRQAMDVMAHSLKGYRRELNRLFQAERKRLQDSQLGIS